MDEQMGQMGMPTQEPTPPQQTMMSDDARMKQMQLQQLAQQIQQFPQRLSQSLSLPAHTGEQVPSPEAMMAKIMAMMSRRHGMPRQAINQDMQPQQPRFIPFTPNPNEFRSRN